MLITGTTAVGTLTAGLWVASCWPLGSDSNFMNAIMWCSNVVRLLSSLWMTSRCRPFQYVTYPSAISLLYWFLYGWNSCHHNDTPVFSPQHIWTGLQCRLITPYATITIVLSNSCQVQIPTILTIKWNMMLQLQYLCIDISSNMGCW